MPTFDGGDDLVGIGGPNERCGVVVGFGDEAVDGGLEIDDRVEHSSFESAFAELGEEGFDGIEPGARGRREVKDEPKVALEPGHDLGMLVSAVVIEDHSHKSYLPQKS